LFLKNRDKKQKWQIKETRLQIFFTIILTSPIHRTTTPATTSCTFKKKSVLLPAEVGGILEFIYPSIQVSQCNQPPKRKDAH